MLSTSCLIRWAGLAAMLLSGLFLLGIALTFFLLAAERGSSEGLVVGGLLGPAGRVRALRRGHPAGRCVTPLVWDGVHRTATYHGSVYPHTATRAGRGDDNVPSRAAGAGLRGMGAKRRPDADPPAQVGFTRRTHESSSSARMRRV